MAEFPSFPFYVNDFLFDEKVDAMTAEEAGAYIRLLCRAWNQKPAGTVPDDDSTLARWSHLSPDRWAACRSAVLAAFSPPSNGRMTQKRMAATYRQMTEAKKAKSAAGRAGAERRWQSHSSAMADPSECHKQPDADMHSDALHSDGVSDSQCSSTLDACNGSARGDLNAGHAPMPKASETARWFLEARPLLDGVAIAPHNIGAAHNFLRQLPNPKAVMVRVLSAAKDRGIVGDELPKYVFKSLKNEAKAAQKRKGAA